jgi:Transposase
MRNIKKYSTMARKTINIHPEWALKYKTPGTELRLQRGRYYLYKISSRYDKETKRTKKITEKFLGTITEADGLIEPKAERARKNAAINEVTVCEYGFSWYLEYHLREYKELARKHFPEHWQMVIAMAYCRLMHQSPLKNMSFHFGNSFLSEDLKGAALSPAALGNAIRFIGSGRQNIVDFCREFLPASGCVVFDGTDITSQSDEMQMPKTGLSKKGGYEQLVNMMCVFSVDKHLPIYYRLLPGDIKDVKSFSLCIEESGAKDALVLADKGFYSKANVEKLESEGLKYIIPLRRSTTLADYSVIKQGDLSAFDGHFMYQGRCIWYYRSSNSRDVCMYLDDEMKIKEKKDFIARMDENSNDESIYTPEELIARQHRFGTIALLSNASGKSPQELYYSYKSRPEVEQMIDTFKNVMECDKTYMQDEKALEEWMLANHIALHWYYKLYGLLCKADLIGKFSPMDIVKFLDEIKIVKINGTWHLAEITNETKKVFDKLGFSMSITDILKS